MEEKCASGHAAPGVYEVYKNFPVSIVKPNPKAIISCGRRVVATQKLDRGTCICSERGVSVPVDLKRDAYTDTDVCSVCFLSRKSGVHTACMLIDEKLKPVEDNIIHALVQDCKSIEEFALTHSIEKYLPLLWIRIMAVCAAEDIADPAHAPDPEIARDRAAARLWITQWRSTLSGSSELDSSYPSQEVMLNNFAAAKALWNSTPKCVQTTFCKFLGPIISKSPAAGSSTTENSITGPEILLIVSGQMNRNGYSVRDLYRPNKIVGFGIFPAVSMINHSCDPNCAVTTWPMGLLQVRTIKTVPAGTELTVSYCDILAPREERQETLLFSKEFECHCMRCDNPDAYAHERELSTPLCPKCFCNTPRTLPRNSDVLKCRTEDGGCGAEILLKDMKIYSRQCQKKITVAVAEASSDPEMVRDFLNEQRSFAETHALIIRARLTLAVEFERLSKHREAAGELSHALRASKMHVPLAWPEFSELMIRKTNNLLLAGDSGTKEAENTLLAAILSLKSSAGPAHPLTARLIKKHKQLSEGKKVF
eukprot:UC4_evm1s344